MSVTKTLVLIGRKGDGKSATGNTILGQSCFAPNLTNSVRLPACDRQSTSSIPGSVEVNVIDTPGLFNTEVPQNEVETELRRIFDLAPNGIDAFLLVLRIGRFTAELHNTVKYFKEVFGNKVMKHTIVVFAGLDDLEFDGVTFDDYIAELPKEVIKLLPDRRVGFNNRSKSKEDKQKQAVFLLKEVTNMENKSKYVIQDFPNERQQQATTNPSWRQAFKDENHGSKDIQVTVPVLSEKSTRKKADTKPVASVRQEKPESQTISISQRSGDVIQQLGIAVFGDDRDIFVKKLVKTYPKFISDEKTPETNESCTRHRGEIDDQLVLFVDIPDLKTVATSEAQQNLIHSLFTGVSVGYHGVILTLRIGSNEADMIRAVNNLTIIFGGEVMKYTVVAFSNSNHLKKYSKNVTDFCKNLPTKISRLLKIPISKDAIWLFDENDSSEAFSIEIERLITLIGIKSRQRVKRERCFTYEMASTGVAQPIERRRRRTRCTIA